uniref:Bug family tripartite tricarboxylate transporter substrate binding protein n=1 Tax=Enterocloster aldenensis TaxID=358742 RepID=UPI00140BBF2E
MRRKIMSILLAASLLMSGCQAAPKAESAGTAGEGSGAAASYPADNLRIIVPFATGGALDVQVRTVARYLADELGTNIIVENKKGAGGIVGMSDYLKEEPNTNTILLINSYLLTGTPLNTKVQYTTEDFVPITDLKMIPYVLFTCPEKSGIHTLEELKAAGSVKFGSDGPGTFLYTGTTALLGNLGITGATVTHDGMTAGLSNMVTGVTDVMLSTTLDQATRGYVKEGQLAPLVYLGDEDYPADDVFTEGIPSARSLGIDMDYYGFYYFAIRSGTDQEIVDKLYTAINNVYQNADFQKDAQELGILFQGKNGAEINTFIEEESKTVAKYTAQK